MQTDTKGLVWRSGSTSATTLTAAWAADTSINCLFLPFTNLTTSSTIRVVVKNSVGTSLYDSGTVSAVPYSNTTWITATGSNYYSYGGGTSVRLYFPSTYTTARSIEVTVTDTTNTQGYMEISRMLAGTYWQLTHNIEFGLSVEYKDSSTHYRTQSGNLLTDAGTITKVLSFSLGYMSTADRNLLVQVFKQNALRRPVLVSLFPADLDKEKEVIHEIYGKLSNSGSLSHPMYTVYTTSLTIEEV
jgi:hypothetical protein